MASPATRLAKTTAASAARAAWTAAGMLEAGCRPRCGALPIRERVRAGLSCCKGVVDGVQQYADATGKASPGLFSEMVAEDRRLHLMGYDIYGLTRSCVGAAHGPDPGRRQRGSGIGTVRAKGARLG